MEVLICLKDDMADILEKVQASDILVVATLTYFLIFIILIMLWKSSGEYSPLRRIVYVIS